MANPHSPNSTAYLAFKAMTAKILYVVGTLIAIGGFVATQTKFPQFALGLFGLGALLFTLALSIERKI